MSTITSQDQPVVSACGKYIYHVSIIDFLQKYNFQKKLERTAKVIYRQITCKNSSRSGHSVDDLSVVNPAKYRKRFL